MADAGAAQAKMGTKAPNMSETKEQELALNPAQMDQAFILVPEGHIQDPRAYLQSVPEPEVLAASGVTLKTLWKLARAVFRRTELPTSLPL